VSEPPTVAFGAWPSPITAARLVEGAAGVGEVRADGDDVWWSEQRPAEGGRVQLVRATPDGVRHDVLPAWDPDGAVRAWNARTAVLEYGGGAWGVRAGTAVFADWADQRLHRVRPGEDPVPLTPPPTVDRGWRWSEPTWLDDRWLVCVRESHEPDALAARGEAADEVVAVPLDGSAVDDPGRVRVLVSGADFVHSPATDGDRLAWLRWDHPRMPWDGTELLAGTVERDDAGDPVGVTAVRLVAGGDDEAIVQPGFTTDGTLVFCTDRTGWWNPCFLADGGSVAPVLADDAEVEIGGGLWIGGLRWWAELADGSLLVAATRDGADGLAVIDRAGALIPLDTPLTEISQVVASDDGASALVVGAGPITEAAPYRVRVAGGIATLEQLRPHRDLDLGTGWISVPTHLSFPSAGGRTAHGLHYAPTNPEVTPPPDERPPLVVMIHGGPTSAARHRLDLAKQFWTSRGFAVVDVNYGGSTGYGRPYRRLLDGAWGIVDVEDAVAAAEHLAAEGLVDRQRLAIRGGSAGGFTTLAALCFHDTFAAGASHYGVADLAALAADTHKFESRYLDGLVGPWPEAEAVYAERSPVRHTDGFDRPLIVLQGSEDEVVPPNQAEMIVDALAAKGVPHAYVLFEGEQHGFRRADSIVAALEAELWFYGRAFGFTPADDLTPVPGAVGL
jgi:dipeptidyl aminopeptidase/acylaminoacyl peptidase